MFFSLEHVKFKCINEIGAMYGKPRVKVKVQRGSTFTFKRDLQYITSYFIYACKNHATGRKRDPRPGETQLSY